MRADPRGERPAAAQVRLAARRSRIRRPTSPTAGRRLLAGPSAGGRVPRTAARPADAHFDKPNRLTVSGVHRGEQRALYDARRDEQIPAHGLRLVLIRPADLNADGRGRLRRNEAADLAALKKILARSSDEDRVTDTFRTWLLAEGWTPIDPTDRWTDLEAVRGSERLICEAKGRTSEKGIDADIAYGQLLRRMASQDPHTRYALVVPSSSLKAAARVPAHIRQLLHIDVYEVTDDDRVCRLTD
ncbi:hypothetical protein OG594_36710 [Streptomyces sp. NBC_01214]|uniref:hypothetical protein n=1 Tax=Streptomyces sp. NBC_01214 TaxID=2903777 RepID=UPI00225BB6B8|nr:hypothetical protein [Streptomyces sp. NBC_01214]MCX4807098.1 hypothetical protein [Streptomyces sp. NBC_01214]